MYRIWRCVTNILFSFFFSTGRASEKKRVVVFDNSILIILFVLDSERVPKNLCWYAVFFSCLQTTFILTSHHASILKRSAYSEKIQFKSANNFVFDFRCSFPNSRKTHSARSNPPPAGDSCNIYSVVSG